jgi:hypothetical protein
MLPIPVGCCRSLRCGQLRATVVTLRRAVIRGDAHPGSLSSVDAVAAPARAAAAAAAAWRSGRRTQGEVAWLAEWAGRGNAPAPDPVPAPAAKQTGGLFIAGMETTRSALLELLAYMYGTICDCLYEMRAGKRYAMKHSFVFKLDVLRGKSLKTFSSLSRLRLAD